MSKPFSIVDNPARWFFSIFDRVANVCTLGRGYPDSENSDDEKEMCEFDCTCPRCEGDASARWHSLDELLLGGIHTVLCGLQPTFHVHSSEKTTTMQQQDPLYFLHLLRSNFPDLWNTAVLSTENAVVCCPQSTSLTSGKLSREEFQAHVLFPSKEPGEYSTHNGWTVSIIGDEVVCGDGFPRPPRKVRVLMSESMDQYLYRVGWSTTGMVPSKRLSQPSSHSGSPSSHKKLHGGRRSHLDSEKTEYEVLLPPHVDGDEEPSSSTAEDLVEVEGGGAGRKNGSPFVDVITMSESEETKGGEGEWGVRQLRLGRGERSNKKDLSGNKVTKATKVSVNKGEAMVRLLHLARPLLGGLVSPPECLHEIDTSVVTKYMAFLRSHPELEGVFLEMERFAVEVGRVLSRGGKAGSHDSRAGLQQCVKEQWSRSSIWLAASECLRGRGAADGLGGDWAGKEEREAVLMQVAESYLLRNLHSYLYPWISRLHEGLDGVLKKACLQLCHSTQSDFGVNARFQCDLSKAGQTLRRVSMLATPMDKILELKGCVRLIQTSVQIYLDKHHQYHNEETVELSTDDLVLLMAWCVVGAYPESCSLLKDLDYIKSFHFCHSDMSSLGFTLSILEVSLDWLIAKVGYQLREVVSKEGCIVLHVEPRPTSTPLVKAGGESLNDLGRPELGECNDSSKVGAGGTGEAQEVSENMINTDRVEVDGSEHSDVTSAAVPEVKEEGWGTEVGMWAVGSDLALRQNVACELVTRGLSLEDFDDPLMNLPTSSEVEGKDVKQVEEGVRGLCGEHDLVKDLRQEQGQGQGEDGTVSAVSEDGGGIAGASVDRGFVTPQASSEQEAAGRRVMVLGNVLRGMAEVLVLSGDDELRRPVRVRQVECGEHYSATLTQEGELYTWGQAEKGCLGHGRDEDGEFVPLITPTRVMGLHTKRFLQVSCGVHHTLAITVAGELFAWGDNSSGQCGLSCTSGSGGDGGANQDGPGSLLGGGGSGALIAQPTQVVIGSSASRASQRAETPVRVMQVACGQYHSLALVSHSMAESHPSLPKQSWRNGGSSGVGAINSGNSSVGSSNVIYSWGRAQCGRLGRIAVGMQHKAYYTPAPVVMDWSYKVSDHREMGKPLMVFLSGGERSREESAGPVHIAAGWSHSVAVTGEGAVFTWGCGVQGRLGQGSHADVFVPRQVRALASRAIRIQSAAAGRGHTLFLSSSGSLFTCGLNQRSHYRLYSNCTNVKANMTCPGQSQALKDEDGLVSVDKLSRPEESEVLSPLPVLGALEGLKVVKIAAGENHSSAITLGNRRTRATLIGEGCLEPDPDACQGHKVFLWGLNSAGECGETEVEMVDEPREAEQFRGASDVACGAEHTVVIL